MHERVTDRKPQQHILTPARSPKEAHPSSPAHTDYGLSPKGHPPGPAKARQVRAPSRQVDELACRTSPPARMQGQPPSIRRKVKRRDKGGQGWGTKGDRDLPREPISETKSSIQGELGPQQNLGGGSPHQPGSKWSWGCASSEGQPAVVRCPPKATTALPAGRGDQCGRKEAAGRCAETYLRFKTLAHSNCQLTRLFLSL